jgi:CRP-like cAMP-binding protein
MPQTFYKRALEDLHRYLSGFAALTKAEFNALLPYIEIREFEKRVQVTKEGEVEQYLNIVVRGLVRKYLPLRGSEVITQLAMEGHMVQSELSFNYRTPSTAVIETIEATTLLSISYESLEELYSKWPKAERLGRLMISHLFIRKDKRYFDQLQKSVRERFLDYVQLHPQMVQRVPQKYIASYLNIKPETFSRLKHLVRASR